MRLLDVMLAVLGLLLCSPLLLFFLLLGWCDTGSPLFIQKRVGKNRRLFTLVKLRTMRVGASQVATHLADVSAITPLGRFLRRSKLDELPQLWNVLLGSMSLVGPRPCLPSQEEVIVERELRGVFAVRPGITGLAQIQGIDMSTPALLADTDRRMIDGMTLRSYVVYIAMTFLGYGSGDRVKF